MDGQWFKVGGGGKKYLPPPIDNSTSGRPLGELVGTIIN